tara:strand:+ start:57 stop:920 length:864 start_codon:yes stop_codon:yes gene_type:complete
MISKIKDFRLSLCISVLLYFCFVSSNLSSEEIKILVYNTHGLPSAFAGDDPEERFPLIGEKTKGYQLSLLQEDFAHHDLLLENLNKESVVMRGNANSKSLCPFCSGSGLTIISNLEKDWQLEVNSEAFGSCSGWLGGLNDCFASKGFQLARIQTPSEKSLYILNTHLDAGRSTSDRRVRAQQLNKILAKVKQETSKEALIVVGDLNLRWNDPKDRALLENFMADLTLIDPITETQSEREWPILDYILYRNGQTTSLQVLEVGEDPKFQYENGPLSDHPALFIKLLIN